MTQTALDRLIEERNEAEYATVLELATAAEARVAQLEESVRILRKALARQEDICAKGHWGRGIGDLF